MADTEHYVRDDVRGFLDMLEAMGGKGVEEVGAQEGREQMRAMGAGGARFTAGGPQGGFDDVFSGLFGQPGGPRGSRRASARQSEFEDLLGGMFGGASAGGFGGPTKGADAVGATTIDFLDAIHGTTVSIQMQSGRTTKAKIPAGVADGQKIRVRGAGSPSPDGGQPGDLVIAVSVRPHPVFTRDGLNLRVDVPVTFVEAVNGATIEVPTLDGDPVRLRVAPGTPSGRVLRVKGRGVVTAKGTGDLLATVVVAVPSHLPDKARQALDDFEAAMPNENPRDDLLSRARNA